MSANPFQFDDASKPIRSDQDYRPSRARIGPPLSRAVYIILALFLGLFGLHNFYAKRFGVGVAQLILSLLVIPVPAVMLWVIIEMVTVDRDGTGRYLR